MIMASLFFCLPDTTKRETAKLVTPWPSSIQCITYCTTTLLKSLRSSKFFFFFSEIPLQVTASLSSKILKEIQGLRVLSSQARISGISVMFMKTVGKFLESDGENLQMVDFPEVCKLSKASPSCSRAVAFN